MLAYNTFFREEPAAYFESDEEHFLYGSVGTEAQEGIPYWIWLVLPRIFPEYLPEPGGWASLGVQSTPGREMPVGLSKVTIGFPRVAINCAICHTTSVRTTPGGPVTLVPGGTSNRMSPQQYLRFLIACASDPRFTPDVILAEIAKNHRLSAYERLIYRFVIIPRTRQALLEVKERESWMDANPDWGRGRIDPFNQVKYRYLKQPKDMTIGNSDMMPLWNLGTRQGPGRAFHWDGLNTDLREVVISSAIGDGTPVSWVERDMAKWGNTDRRDQSSLRRVYEYISRLQPPKYPLADRCLAVAAGRRALQDALCVVSRKRGEAYRHDHPGRGGRDRSTSSGHVDARRGRHLQRVERRLFVADDEVPEDRRLSVGAAGRAVAARRRISTTVPCRRWPICSNRLRRGPRSSGAATICSIR